MNKIEEHFIVERAGRRWVFTSNRPFYRNKGLRHRMDLKLIEGTSGNITFEEKLKEGIEARVRLAEVL